MLSGISSRMWSEWHAFWQEYGWGERRMDVRFAQLMAQIANLVRKEGAPTVSAGDFLPDEGGDEWEGDDDGEPDVIVDEDQIIFEALVREAMGDTD